MYDGVKAMIKKEKDLKPKPKPTKCGPHLIKPEDLIGFPEFP